MSAERYIDYIPGFLDHTLNPIERAAFERAMERSNELRNAVASLQKTQELVADVLGRAECPIKADELLDELRRHTKKDVA